MHLHIVPPRRSGCRHQVASDALPLRTNEEVLERARPFGAGAYRLACTLLSFGDEFNRDRMWTPRRTVFWASVVARQGADRG